MAKAIDLTGKRVGHLVVQRVVDKKDRPTQNHGNYWYCICDCGNQVKVPTTYLTGNSNYVQTSCGCDRKKRAFQVSSDLELDNDYLMQFSNNFEKYMFLHKSLVRTSGNNSQYYKEHLEEYKETIDYFWNNEQFTLIYDFWQNHKSLDKTFYDWAKPSLDHIIPKSRGGSNYYTNLQFLTTFENLAKRDMTQDEWIRFKEITHTTSDYFLERIREVEQK